MAAVEMPQPLPERPGFVAGARCLFAGIGWLFKTPSAWPLALVPLILAMLLTGTLASVSLTWMPALVERLVGPTDGALGGIGVGILKVLATLLALVLSGLLGLSLAQPLSGPALEGLARQHERELGAPERAPTNFMVDIFRSLKSLAVGYMVGLPALVILAILSLVLPFASVVTVPLKLLVAAFTIAWDLCDYPLSIRGLRVRTRLGTVWRYRSAVLGFSLGLALCGLVPCLLFLFLPAGVAGASRLMWIIEQRERSEGRLWKQDA